VATVDKVPFDPALGARILAEIQAEGLRAASALVDRLVHLVDGPHQSGPEGAPGAATDRGSASNPLDMGAVKPWFDLWRDLVERTSETLQRLQGAGTGPAGDGVQLGVDGSLVPAHPLIVAIGPNGSGRGEMWLHNGTAEDPGELIPRCGPLNGPNGSPLDCTVTIDPPQVDGLPSRSSRGFAITVSASRASAPGTYRGIVQVRGADAVWMPIEVVVA